MDAAAVVLLIIEREDDVQDLPHLTGTMMLLVAMAIAVGPGVDIGIYRPTGLAMDMTITEGIGGSVRQNITSATTTLTILLTAV